MATQQTVIDELVVKLSLDAREYDKNSKKIDEKVTRTNQNLGRLGEGADKASKGLFGLGKAGLLVGAAIGAVAGLSAAVASIVDLEARLRRLGVATGFSNRSLQAWGSTARRLGADANAGRQAIADLAREQRQFSITGSAPTLSALARMGVQVGRNTSIVDMLAQAQQIYRAAPTGQRDQMETGLSALGVSDDLILMIKSEKDVREQFKRSYMESSNENRKALDAAVDIMETKNNAAVAVKSKLLDAGESVVEGFASALHGATDVVREFAHQVRAALGQGPVPADIAAKSRTSALVGARPGSTAHAVMQYLIMRHGLTVDRAAAVASSLQAESGFDPNAYNAGGGGHGARGIAQWRDPGGRQPALLASGAKTLWEQIDFMMTNPYERALMNRAFAEGGNLGTAVSRFYEGHDNFSEHLRRGRQADLMAEDYRKSGAPTVGQQINVQTLNVQANNPAQLGQQLKRQSEVQNYNSGVR